MSRKTAPARTRVVMDEKAGFGHVEPLRPDQLKRLASNTPEWATKCRATRTKTDTEGSKA